MAERYDRHPQQNLADVAAELRQSAEKAHLHEWEVEYLPDPMSAGSVVRSGDLFCACGETTPDVVVPPASTPEEGTR